MNDPVIKQIVVDEFAEGKRLGLTREQILKNVNKRVQEYIKSKLNVVEETVVVHMPQPIYGTAPPPVWHQSYDLPPRDKKDPWKTAQDLPPRDKKSPWETAQDLPPRKGKH